VVQLFDTSESLADSVFAFVRDGLFAGEGVVLIVTAAHWDAVRRVCLRNSVDLTTAREAGWLVVLDADDVVSRIMRRDRPDKSLFDALVEPMLQSLRGRHSRLRVFGEAVDVLVRRNDFAGAQLLEDYWNQLLEGQSFTLCCGYSSEHFGNPRDAEALRQVCGCHSHVHVDTRDVLGNFLVKTHAAC
jgi:hypothetical protein